MGCLPPSDITAIFRKQSAWSDTHTQSGERSHPASQGHFSHRHTHTYSQKELNTNSYSQTLTRFSKQQVKAVKA